MQILIYTNDHVSIKWVEEQVVKTGTCSFSISSHNIAETAMLLRSLRIDAIIYDITAFGKRPKQITTALLEVRGDIPVIVLTSVLTLPAAVETVKMGADTYLMNEKAEPGILAEYLKVVIAKKQETAKRYAVTEPSPDVMFFMNRSANQ